MSIDITGLVDQACRRANIALDALADARIDTLTADVVVRPYDQSVTFSADRYHTVIDGIAMLIDAEPTSLVHGDLQELLDDCRDYWPLASFMRAAIAILRETPDLLPGVKMNMFTLSHIEARLEG
jgi:hypothetical protein